MECVFLCVVVKWTGRGYLMLLRLFLSSCSSRCGCDVIGMGRGRGWERTYLIAKSSRMTPPHAVPSIVPTPGNSLKTLLGQGRIPEPVSLSFKSLHGPPATFNR